MFSTMCKQSLQGCLDEMSPCKGYRRKDSINIIQQLHVFSANWGGKLWKMVIFAFKPKRQCKKPLKDPLHKTTLAGLPAHKDFLSTIAPSFQQTTVAGHGSWKSSPSSPSECAV